MKEFPVYGNGGRGEIRTPGCLATSPDFESGALDHSATLPFVLADKTAATDASNSEEFCPEKPLKILFFAGKA